MRRLNDIYALAANLIWVKGSLGAEFTSEGLDGWLHEENFSIDTNIRLQDWKSQIRISFSSPSGVFERKPFVFNETFRCPREQYHLAICLPASILTRYKRSWSNKIEITFLLFYLMKKLLLHTMIIEGLLGGETIDKVRNSPDCNGAKWIQHTRDLSFNWFELFSNTLT